MKYYSDLIPRYGGSISFTRSILLKRLMYQVPGFIGLLAFSYWRTMGFIHGEVSAFRCLIEGALLYNAYSILDKFLWYIIVYRTISKGINDKVIEESSVTDLEAFINADEEIEPSVVSRALRAYILNDLYGKIS